MKKASALSVNAAAASKRVIIVSPYHSRNKSPTESAPKKDIVPNDPFLFPENENIDIHELLSAPPPEKKLVQLCKKCLVLEARRDFAALVDLRVECLSLAVLVYGDLEEPLAEGALLPASPPITAHLVFDLAKAYLLNHQPHQCIQHATRLLVHLDRLFAARRAVGAAAGACHTSGSMISEDVFPSRPGSHSSLHDDYFDDDFDENNTNTNTTSGTASNNYSAARSANAKEEDISSVTTGLGSRPLSSIELQQQPKTRLQVVSRDDPNEEVTARGVRPESLRSLDFDDDFVYDDDNIDSVSQSAAMSAADTHRSDQSTFSSQFSIQAPLAATPSQPLYRSKYANSARSEHIETGDEQEDGDLRLALLMLLSRAYAFVLTPSALSLLPPITNDVNIDHCAVLLDLALTRSFERWGQDSNKNIKIMMMQAELLSFSCGMQSRIATITLLEQCWVSLDRRSPLVIPLCVALSHQHLSAVAEHMQNSGSVAEQVIKLLNRARDVTSSALELQQELAEAMASRENNPNSTFDKHANLDRFQLLYRAAHCCLLSRDDEVALKYLRDALACSRALQAAQRKTASTMAAVASASFVTQGQSTWWGICLQPMQCHTGLSLSCDISPHAFDKLFAIQLIRSKRTKECIEFLQKRVADQTAECGERCLPTADLWQCLGDTYAYQGNLAEAGEAFSKALSCALSIAASASTFNQADVAVHQSLHDIVVKATMTSYVQSLAPAIIETLRAKLRAVRFNDESESPVSNSRPSSPTFGQPVVHTSVSRTVPIPSLRPLPKQPQPLSNAPSKVAPPQQQPASTPISFVLTALEYNNPLAHGFGIARLSAGQAGSLSFVSGAISAAVAATQSRTFVADGLVDPLPSVSLLSAANGENQTSQHLPDEHSVRHLIKTARDSILIAKPAVKPVPTHSNSQQKTALPAIKSPKQSDIPSITTKSENFEHLGALDLDLALTSPTHQQPTQPRKPNPLLSPLSPAPTSPGITFESWSSPQAISPGLQFAMTGTLRLITKAEVLRAQAFKDEVEAEEAVEPSEASGAEGSEPAESHNEAERSPSPKPIGKYSVSVFGANSKLNGAAPPPPM